MNRLFFNFFLLGLSLGVGPCMVSCGPLLISYLAGTNKNQARSIWAYALFSSGRLFVYALLGLSVFLFGQMAFRNIFGFFPKYIYLSAGIFIVAVGLLMLVNKEPQYRFCRALQGIFLKKDKKTIFIFGLAMGILPCLPFMSAVSYIGLVSKNWFESLLYSLSFGLGTITSPLFIVVWLTGFMPIVMAKNNMLRRLFNSLCGIIIIFLGLRLIARAFQA